MKFNVTPATIFTNNIRVKPKTSHIIKKKEKKKCERTKKQRTMDKKGISFGLLELQRLEKLKKIVADSDLVEFMSTSDGDLISIFSNNRDHSHCIFIPSMKKTKEVEKVRSIRQTSYFNLHKFSTL